MHPNQLQTLYSDYPQQIPILIPEGMLGQKIMMPQQNFPILMEQQRMLGQ
jgi:hypothetical protein